jgi:uncharacterized damage-inducible protein DinB
MQKRTAELITYLDATRARLVETASAINPAFAAMKARENTWSVEQNVAHLAIVEDGVARLVSKSVAWAKANGIGPEVSEESMMSSLDKYGIADATFKLEAPSTVAPDARPIADSLNSLAASRGRLKEALLDGDGLDLTQVRRIHPAMGDIDVYQWVLFVAQHEERHRRQIEKTLGETVELAAECAPIV